jgi:hypothetical protein
LNFEALKKTLHFSQWRRPSRTNSTKRRYEKTFDMFFEVVSCKCPLPMMLAFAEYAVKHARGVLQGPRHIPRERRVLQRLDSAKHVRGVDERLDVI